MIKPIIRIPGRIAVFLKPMQPLNSLIAKMEPTYVHSSSNFTICISVLLAQLSILLFCNIASLQHC